tara:strand:- start:426 stop:623 length:198 start_codon:yes stop_codon:yes gene_type:complete
LVLVVQLVHLMVGEVLVVQILYLALLHPQAVAVVVVVERLTLLSILDEMVALVVEWVVVQEQQVL